MKTFIHVLTLTVMLGLSGCASMSKQEVGTVAGAVGGGVLGNVVTGGNVVGTVAGAAGGAYVGNRLAK